MPWQFDFHALWCPHGARGVPSQFSFEALGGGATKPNSTGGTLYSKVNPAKLL